LFLEQATVIMAKSSQKCSSSVSDIVLYVLLQRADDVCGNVAALTSHFAHIFAVACKRLFALI
jgi:hypothetical protein